MIDRPMFTDDAAWLVIEEAWAAPSRPRSPSRDDSDMRDADHYHAVCLLKDSEGFLGVAVVTRDDEADMVVAEIVYEDPYQRWSTE